MKFNFSILIFSVLLAALAAANFSFALEQTYPDVGGIQLSQLARKAVSPQHFLKFITTWAIVLSVAVIVGSLIYAGIAYLVSVGKPQATADARQRVKNSFLGLAIVMSAYLVLALVNPQLTIFYLERQSIKAGIVLFSELGYQEFQNKGASAILDIIDQGWAQPLPHDVANLIETFGPLAVQKWGNVDPLAPNQNEPQIVNFTKLPLYAIGFWPDIDPQTKVALYSQPDFDTTAPQVIYTKAGRINQSGVPMGSQTKDGMSLVKLETGPGDGFFKTTVSFLRLGIDEFAGMSAQEQQDWQDKNLFSSSILHPPLSIAIQNAEPGIYLYSEKNEELFLTEGQPFLDRVSFDKKAVRIKVKNFSDASSANLFAVLREEFQDGGSAKIFFPKAALGHADQVVPQYCPDGTPISGASKPNSCWYPGQQGFDGQTCQELFGDNVKNDKISFAVFNQAMANLSYLFASEVGNLDENEIQQISFNENERKASGANPFDRNIDRYGVVNSVSSVAVFQFADDFSTCQEVQICDKEGGQDTAGSRCISYLAANNPELLIPEKGVAKYPLPLFEPINIPEKACVVREIDETTQTITLEEVRIANEVRSISLNPEGGCLVGLFDSSVQITSAGFQAWAGNNTGRSTTFFTATNTELLGRAAIGKCGSGGVLRRDFKPCASAIVVYPLAGAAGAGLEVGYLTGSGAAKAAAALNKFTRNIVSAIKNSGVCNSQEKFGSIILDGQTQKIDPATFVQMIIVQESMGNKDACHVDVNVSQITCGLMQAQIKPCGPNIDTPCTCNPNPCVGSDAVSNIQQGIRKLKEAFDGCPDKVCGDKDGSVVCVSCSVAKTKGAEFWPYAIINYNTVNREGNKRSGNQYCGLNTCDQYNDISQYPNGGCFLPVALQSSAYTTKVECPIKRGPTDETGYNVTYRYILNVREGYAYLKSLGNDLHVASCP